MIAATLLALACTGGEPSAPDQPAFVQGEGVSLTLVYTANVHGEIEPCG